MDNKGFTLVELAMVLLIIGLLLGGLLSPLASQVETRSIRSTDTIADEIRSALLGFAVIYERLPCPTWADSPLPGEEDCARVQDSQGLLSWKTLGVNETDAWGNQWRYRPDSRYRTAFAVGDEPADNLEVFSEHDNMLAGRDQYEYNGETIVIDPPAAVFYSPGSDKQDDMNNDEYNETFSSSTGTAALDDRAYWISRMALVEILISARKMP